MAKITLKSQEFIFRFLKKVYPILYHLKNEKANNVFASLSEIKCECLISLNLFTGCNNFSYTINLDSFIFRRDK